MVFPSPACQTCKKRRIKCDTLKPSCGRCCKAGRVCVWNPNDAEGVHFKNENAFAQGQRRRPRLGRETIPKVVAFTNPSVSTIPSPLSLPLETHALHYWARNFAFRLEELPDIGHEYSSYVLLVLARARPDSSIHHALSAFSHAVFGRARQFANAMQIADTAYARGIVKTYREMNTMDNEGIDQLLITIMLMNSYENIMYGDERHHSVVASPKASDAVGSRFWQTVCHIEGVSGLLKLRKDLGVPHSLQLGRMVRRQIIRTCILRGVCIPEWLRDGTYYGEEGPALELDSLMVQVAALRAKSLRLFRAESLPVFSEVKYWERIVVEAETLDFALDSWSRAVPQEWKSSVREFTSCLILPNPCYPNVSSMYTYQTLGHASTWNRYYATRLIVNSIGIRSLSMLSQYRFPSPQRVAAHNTYLRTMNSLVNDLCRSIPFFFHYSLIVTREDCNGIEQRPFTSKNEVLPKIAVLLAWPLTIAVSTDGTPEPQRQWLKDILKLVAKSMGDVILDSVVENGEFRF
ncbi:hypothetical protein M501DRAFT_1018970 [Patellaria atrata CBS 101060]|uniref:Zn(2)-C6 fungal-type domain-containing protein n=1 Tax=Patellaria atrata CBS 101060 TaxID=1346257 RepID=A0A9P4S6K6_9PEZI|nr:hypothetical protein M501DRAFT_1018970 [Patellaria atrata CBS 101060]